MSIPLFFVLLLGFTVITYLLYKPRWRARRRKQIKDASFPAKWKNVLLTQWPLYREIPDLLKEGLHQRIQLFIQEKQFVGCDGFQITEEHRLLIAAQACLLVINKPYEYFDELKSILVYPSAFIVKHNRQLANGTIAEEQNVNSGEAWETGKIVLSWDDAYAGMINIKDGENVVIHEFAHLLDHTNGTANGAPLLEHAKNYDVWSKTFQTAYNRLLHNLHTGEKSVFNPYGAASPGEFFAVASEMFFERSRLFQSEEPELYQELVRFYAVDPTLW
ncbi:MAG: zinc-dependent peptidase [Gammaproteobacteria bacterium]|nr:zinc-dependent peptidase [Gammaproteobacteria bacterium]